MGNFQSEENRAKLEQLRETTVKVRKVPKRNTICFMDKTRTCYASCKAYNVKQNSCMILESLSEHKATDSTGTTAVLVYGTAVKTTA